MMARTDPQVNVRIPSEVLQRVASDATANKRSATAEIVSRLEAEGDELRDRIAIAALPAIIGSSYHYLPVKEAARIAYEYADAMLAVREGGAA